MLDIGALRAFYYVGKFGGIGAAARELKVTQPAVSQRVAQLERLVGKKLHGQAGRRLVLTEEGRRIYEACRQAFDTLEALESSLSGAGAPVGGTVRIASLSEVAKVLLLPNIRAFREKNPAVRFDLQYRLPYEILSSLSRHEVDFAITNEPYRRPQVELVPCFLERVVLAGPGPSRRLSWPQLEGLPWLSYGSEDPLWFEFERLAMRHGAVLPRPAFMVAEVESVLRLAAEGAGYALVPEHALRLRRLPGLCVHKPPFGAFTRQVYACRLRTVAPGQAAQAFWEFLLDRRKGR